MIVKEITEYFVALLLGIFRFAIELLLLTPIVFVIELIVGYFTQTTMFADTKYIFDLSLDVTIMTTFLRGLRAESGRVLTVDREHKL
jgi:hypothetical protein